MSSQFSVVNLAFFLERVSNPKVTTGAILAMDNRGRETPIEPVQKEFFDGKLVILCLQTNLTR